MRSQRIASKTSIVTHIAYSQETILHRLAESNLLPVYFWTNDGTIYDPNNAFLTMLGYTQDDVIKGRFDWEYSTPPEYRSQDTAVIRALVDIGYAKRIEKEFVAKDGHRVPAIVVNIALDTPCTHGAAFVVDQSEQRHALEELRSSEQRFRATFEQAAVGIAHVSPDGSWLRVNQRLCEIVGYSRDELMQTSFQAITYPDDLATDLEYVQQMLAGKIDRYQMQKRYRHKAGSTVWTNLTVSLVRDPIDNTPLYFISVLEDIHDKKRAEQDVEKQAELLRLSQDAIAVRYFDGTILSWNPSAESLYGWTENEACGRVTHDLLRTRFPISLDEQEHKLRTAGHWEGELIHTRKDGHEIIVSSRQSLRRGGTDGIADLVLEANRDITEEKRAREAERASQARLAAIIDSAMDAIVTADAEQCVVAFNPAAERMFGYSATEVLGQPLTMLMPHRFQFAHVGLLEGFGRRGATNRAMGALGVVYARRQNGTEFPIEATISQVQAGGQIYYTAIIRDVTERERESQEQQLLLDLGERVRQLTDPHEVMDVTVRAVGEYLKVPYCLFTEVDMNTGTLHLSSQFAATDRPLRPDDDVQPLEFLATTEMVERLKQGEVVIVADTATDPLTATIYSDHLAPLSIRSVILAPCLSGGRWVGLLGVDQDTPRVWTSSEVSFVEAVAERIWRQVENARLFQAAQSELAERRRVETDLRQLMDTLEERVTERTAALQEANTSLESFNHVVAHDLRAPLRAMQGFAQALEEDYSPELDEEARDYIGRIVEGADRMNALLSDLLAYSRLARADLRATLVPVSLSLVINDALRALEADIAVRHASVNCETPLPIVLANRSTLTQVVMNLIGNAIKFVPVGVTPQVRVWSEERSETVNSTGIRSLIRLWVEDNGIGIATEYQERIWRVFERLHGIEQYPGTGVGLAIVAKGMERMGGTAGVISKIEEGSRFWIELPQVLP